MFEEVRKKHRALDRDEALRILSQTRRGVLSLVRPDGYPYGVPINHYFDPDTMKLYFHGDVQGNRIECAEKDDRASFCAFQERKTEKKHWYKTFESVIVFGHLKTVEERERKAEIVWKLTRGFTEDMEEFEAEIEKAIDRTSVIEMSIEHVTGKFIDEK
ncbi:MAG: pyridoxamine 5'-phosphate oxidase family protein [Erysipelotrichaceae bacterium]|nr:pyridoxamine 5'-phosphate oxidase family protein [Erysipelotrichaceae bacterium]